MSRMDGVPAAGGRSALSGTGAGKFALRLAVPVIATLAISGVGLSLADVITARSISMLYLAGVVASALIGGRTAAIVAALLSFLAYDFLFIEPRWTLTVAHADEVVALVIFVGVALATGTLAARRGEDAALARRKANATQRLLEFSAGLSAAYGLEAVYEAIATLLGRALGVPVVVLVLRDADVAIASAVKAVTLLSPQDRAAAIAAADKRIRTGATTGAFADSAYLFLPIISGQRLLAVLGLQTAGLNDDQNEILGGMIEQAAIAIDRAQRVRESGEANLVKESERLQSALLSSLSHDFRTPLASIIGAASSIRQLGDRMDQATRMDLLESIEEDAVQLNRFVANLFDMTRIESGRLSVRRDVIALPEAVERAIERVRAIYPEFAVETSFAPDLGPVEGDAVLLEQVLFNLLDNARKYAGTMEPVNVFARPDGEWIALSVTDRGKGIPAADLERIFDKFYRRGGRDGRGPGTGLGLSIARGFIAAMGGAITADSPAFRKRGTRFTIRLKPVRGLVA